MTLLAMVAVLFFSERAASFQQWSVKQLVEYHQGSKRDMRVQDVYKLLYQSHFGVEHTLRDRTNTLSFLNDELAVLDSAFSGESLIEPISTSNDIVRINLRPYKALNLDPAALVELTFRAPRETLPDTLMFFRQWSEYSALVRYGLLDFSPDELKEFDQRITDGKLDPVHHSTDYSSANKPAYRVLRRDLFEETFGNLQQDMK